MNRCSKSLLVITVAVNLALPVSGFASATCDSLTGNLFNLCEAYCESMNCDSDNPNASGGACNSVLKKWNRQANGEILPCLTEPSISLVKKVNGVTEPNPNNNPIDEGTSIVYTFDITNNGDVDLTGLTLSDTTLTNSGGTLSCSPSQPFDLAVGASASCTSNTLNAVVGEHINTASVDGFSIYNDAVSGTSTTAYLGVASQAATCPCEAFWDSGTYGTKFSEADFSFSFCYYNPNLSETQTNLLAAQVLSSNVTYSIIASSHINGGPDYCRVFTTINGGTSLVPDDGVVSEAEAQACVQLLQDRGCSF